MSIFDVLRFVVYSFLAFGLGRYFGTKYGIVAGIIAGLAGLAFGMICWRFLGWLTSAYYRHNPRLPDCRKGHCQTKDYTLLKKDKEGSTFVCKCGDNYLLTKDLRFCEKAADGSTSPFLKIGKSGTWIADEILSS